MSDAAGRAKQLLSHVAVAAANESAKEMEALRANVAAVLRDKDQRIAELEAQLREATAHIGRLKALVTAHEGAAQDVIRHHERITRQKREFKAEVARLQGILDRVAKTPDGEPVY